MRQTKGGQLNGFDAENIHRVCNKYCTEIRRPYAARQKVRGHIRKGQSAARIPYNQKMSDCVARDNDGALEFLIPPDQAKSRDSYLLAADAVKLRPHLHRA